MTSQRLYETLRLLDALDNRLRLQPSLEAVGNALTTLVSQPAQPQHQATLANALSAFEAAASQLRDSITPSQFEAIKGMGGEEFFDPSIADKVKASVQTNAMTPSVAKDFVQDIVSRRSQFLTNVRQALNSLGSLGVNDHAVIAGSAELAFLIPREIFKNELAAFAKELTFIDRLIEHISEARTGQPETAKLEQLSSSTPTVALATSVFVIQALAIIVKKFVDTWEKIEKIRKIRAELAEMGLSGTAALEELTERVTTTIDEVVEESVETVVVNYEGSTDRKNELRNALRQDTHRLFGQIERGLTVEFRAEPKKDADDATQKALENITTLATQMQFPPVAKEPMLLGNGEILEGDLRTVKQSKKSTTHKSTTTTSKKEVAKEHKNEDS
jgi:hypothetical protein